MCGRYCIAASPGELAERYHVSAPAFFFPRFNVAPSEPIPAVISHQNHTEILVGNFGFSQGLKGRVINARVESIQEKPPNPTCNQDDASFLLPDIMNGSRSEERKSHGTSIFRTFPSYLLPALYEPCMQVMRW